MTPAGAFQPHGRDDAGCSYDDDFAMFTMKVAPCPKSSNHLWADCPYVHSGEKARRRDPSTHSGIACPAMKQDGHCPRGDACTYAHSAWEYWLHPSRYKSALCSKGEGCTRKFCFFAHRVSELRVPEVPPGGEGMGRAGVGMPHLAMLSSRSPSRSPSTGSVGGAATQQGLGQQAESCQQAKEGQHGKQAQQARGQQAQQQAQQQQGKHAQQAQAQQAPALQQQAQQGAAWGVQASSGQQVQGALQCNTHEQKAAPQAGSQGACSTGGDQALLYSARCWPPVLSPSPPASQEPLSVAIPPAAVASQLLSSGLSSPTGPSTPLFPAAQAQQPLLFSDTSSTALPDSVWTEALPLGALLQAFSQEMAVGTMDFSLACSLLARLLPAQTRRQQFTACGMEPGSQPVAALAGPSGPCAEQSWGWESGAGAGQGGACLGVGLPEVGWPQLQAAAWLSNDWGAQV